MLPRLHSQKEPEVEPASFIQNARDFAPYAESILAAGPSRTPKRVFGTMTAAPALPVVLPEIAGSSVEPEENAELVWQAIRTPSGDEVLVQTPR